MHTFRVYRQFTPVCLRAPTKVNPDGEYAANFVHVGDCTAPTAELAVAVARLRYGLAAPVVERVLH